MDRIAPPVDFDAHPWAERFAAKVHVRADGCWEWLGTRDRRYGRFYAGGGVDADKWAHRRSYEMFVGPIPDGLTIDHLCRFTFCVNPAHLEAVTQAENMRRAVEAHTPPDHGTHARYHAGCKCDECGEAGHRYRTSVRAERRRQFAAGEIEITHGTRYGYAYYLCRCEPCSAAGLADAERRRRAAGVRPKAVAQHGSLAKYAKHKCRCDECRAGWAAYWRQKRATRRDSLRESEVAA